MTTREIKDDYAVLQEYINNYSIAAYLSNSDYASHLKSLHRIYFSILTYREEFLKNINSFKKKYSVTEDSKLYICESISDYAYAYFNWINGCYKPCKIMARACIENFIRGVYGVEDVNAFKLKDTYKLMADAKASKIFNINNTITKTFDKLHSDYKVLCSDAHTSTAKNMGNVTSLGQFPSYNKHKSKECKDLLVRIGKCLIILLCLIFVDLFHKFHHRNKSNILSNVPSSIRSIIYGITTA